MIILLRDDANYDCVHYDEDDNDMDHDSVDNDNDWWYNVTNLMLEILTLYH